LLRLRLTAIAALPAAVALARVGLARVNLELATIVTALPLALRLLNRRVDAIAPAAGKLTAFVDGLCLRLRGRLRLNHLRSGVPTAARETAAFPKVGTGRLLYDLLRRLRLPHGSAFAALELGAGLLMLLRLRLGLRLGLRLRLGALGTLARLLGARRLVLALTLVTPVTWLRQGGGRHQRQGQRHKGDALHDVTPIGPR